MQSFEIYAIFNQRKQFAAQVISYFKESLKVSSAEELLKEVFAYLRCSKSLYFQ